MHGRHQRANRSASGAHGRLRRRTLAVLGAAGLGLAALAGPARAAGSTEALLLSCMDYRLVDDTERYMSGRGLRDRYDHIVLAGASLGALTESHPAWGETFWQHLAVAIELHHVARVVVLDHRDCGAYEVILGEDLAGDPAREAAVHAEHLEELGRRIRSRYPHLEVELLLMDLDGKVGAQRPPAAGPEPPAAAP
jgi:carbonic anhydrase